MIQSLYKSAIFSLNETKRHDEHAWVNERVSVYFRTFRTASALPDNVYKNWSKLQRYFTTAPSFYSSSSPWADVHFIHWSNTKLLRIFLSLSVVILVVIMQFIENVLNRLIKWSQINVTWLHILFGPFVVYLWIGSFDWTELLTVIHIRHHRVQSNVDSEYGFSLLSEVWIFFLGSWLIKIFDTDKWSFFLNRLLKWSQINII